MPRRRTIALTSGHLQLKLDMECDQCGSMTYRERNRWIARGTQLTIVAAVGSYGGFKTKGAGLVLIQG